MHGLPGSGKTTRAAQFMRAGAVRIRSDVERKRLHGVGELQDSAAAGLDIYTGDSTRATYERLMAAADAALSGGLPVVLDAAFLQREWRELALALARRHGVQFAICSCQAPEELLRVPSPRVDVWLRAAHAPAACARCVGRWLPCRSSQDRPPDCGGGRSRRPIRTDPC